MTGREIRILRWLRDAATKNLGYKALAIVIALVFFYTRETESVSHRTLSIPVIAMLDPGEERILVSGFPEQVTLRLEGPVSALKELHSQDVGPAVVPITEIEGQQFRFTREIFNLPDDVKINSIYPETVPVQFEERIERQVPLVASIQGTPADGRYMGPEVRITPAKVTVSGAASAMERVEQWDTEPLYIDELDPGKHEIELNLAPPKVANLYIEQEPTAVVSLEILQKQMERWIRQVPIGIEGAEPDPGFKLKPPTVSVYLRGPVEIVEDLTSDHLYFYAVLTEEEALTVGSFQKDVKHASPPEGVEFVKIVPMRLLVMNRSQAALKYAEENP